MPLYEYHCLACRHRFEELAKLGDYAKVCPECGGPLLRLYGPFLFRFRSRGWKPYSVDGAVKDETVKEEICVSE